jgi:hypothetical protein
LKRKTAQAKIFIDEENVHLASMVEHPIGGDIAEREAASADFDNLSHAGRFRLDDGHGDFAFAHVFNPIQKMPVGADDGKHAIVDEVSLVTSSIVFGAS